MRESFGERAAGDGDLEGVVPGETGFLALQDVGAKMGSEGRDGGVCEEVWWLCHRLLVVMRVGKRKVGQVGRLFDKDLRGIFVVAGGAVLCRKKALLSLVVVVMVVVVLLRWCLL